MTGLLKVIVVMISIFGQPSSAGRGVEIQVYEDGVVRAVGVTDAVSQHIFTLPYSTYVAGVWDEQFYPCGEVVKLDSERESIVIRCERKNSNRLPLITKER